MRTLLQVLTIFKAREINTSTEVFKKTSKTKGEIIEFGVFKGNSLIRLISFNKICYKYKKDLCI